MNNTTNNVKFNDLKVAALSLGCEKNRVDTEEILGYLTGKGAVFTDDYRSADLVIVNTCGFIESAQQEAINTLIEVGRQVRRGKTKLIAAGCLVEVFGSRLLDNLPEIDGAIGVHSYDQLEQFIYSLQQDRRPFVKNPPAELYCSLGPRLLTRPKHSVTVKIAEGCSNRCCYCMIPAIRGSYRSRPADEIVSEVKSALQDGAKEIVLIAQDTTAYGTEETAATSLSDLLNAIMYLPERFWLRIMYTYPSRVDDHLLHLIKNEPRICRYLDLPIQHSDSYMLRQMGRHYDNEQLTGLVDQIRFTVPGIALRTTCMVGYPGETRRRFENMLHFMQSRPFERVGAFVYSAQQGTAAVKMGKLIPTRVAENRKKELMSAQQQIALKLNHKLVGTDQIVLIDDKDPAKEGWYRGRTQYQAPDVDGLIYVKSAQPLEAGDWVRAKINAVSPYNYLSIEAEKVSELPV